jgi:hypothetical protein
VTLLVMEVLVEFKTYRMPDSWYFIPTIQYKKSAYTSYSTEKKDFGDGWIAHRPSGPKTKTTSYQVNCKFLCYEVFVVHKKEIIV